MKKTLYLRAIRQDDELIKLATSGSRFVIMYPDGVKAYGTWETDDDGVLYSNSTYKRPRWTTIYNA